MIYLEPTDLAFMNTDQLIQESIDFQKIKSSVKEKAQRFVEWVGKCVKYIRSIIARHIKLKRAEKIQKEMDDLMKREGWNIKLDDIDIPGDEYENMFEAAEQYLIGDLTESDIKTFAKNILLNKKVILNLATKIIPGVSTAQLAISLPKTIAMLTPIVMDFIDTSKEIVLLKEKYAGKTKKIKNPDGTICAEMPAEAFITLDKYKKLADRILDITLKEDSPKGEQVVFKLNSTEDLIRVTASLTTKMENNITFQTLSDNMDNFMNTVTKVDPETKFDDTMLSASYKHIPNSCIECMMMIINMVSDSISAVGSFYVNNTEYTLNMKPFISEVQPIMTDLMNLAINMMKDINTLELTGEKTLIIAKKIITKYTGKVISAGLKADNNAKERGITNENLRKKLLAPAHSMKESYDIYTEARKPEKVIDGYLGDLPENLQSDVMEIHKLVIKTVNEILNTRDYSDLKNDKWAKEQLEEFCAMPADKSDIGSIRVYQRGKKYRCMIQLTGHFTNHMNDFNQELMHEFIKNVFVTVRPKIRKKYDFTITNEGDHGNPFEGFDVFPNPKLVEEIWNKLSDRKIKTVMEESVDDSDILSTRIDSDTGHILMLSFSNYMTEMVKNHTDIEENINMIENWNSSMFTDNTMVEASKLFKITSKSLIPFVEQCERELLRDDLNADDTIMYMERLERVQELQEYLSEYDTQEFTEKSHGKLKYDFRFARNADNGKMLKIVYELNKDMDVDTYRDANYSTISKLGDTDHNSSGQKVVAIIEYIDDPSVEGGRTRNLDHVKCIGPFGYNNDTVFDIKVGEIDNSYSFKSTFFPPKHELIFGRNKTYNNIKDVTIMGHECRPNQRGHFAKNKLYFNKSELMKYILMNNNIRSYCKSIYDTIYDRFIADYSFKNNIDKSSKEVNDVWFNHSRKLSEINELKEIENKFNEIRANYIPPHGDSILSIVNNLASNRKSSNTSREQHNKDIERYTNELNQLLPGYIAGYKEAIKSLDSLVKKYNIDVNSDKFHKYMESVNEFTESSIQYNRVSGKLKDLPKGFQKFAIETNEDILEAVLTEMQRHKDFDSLDDDDVKELINWMDAKNNEDGYGYFFIEKDKDDKNFAGEMRLFPKTGKEFGYISRKLEAIWNKSLKYVFDKKHSAINKKDPTKKLTLVTDENIYTLVFVFSREYAEKLYNYCINPRRFPLTESASIEENETYNVDMTESEAKRTLGTLTASIINDINNKKPVSQYTANIYANIITKNLLPLWSKGYRKLSIKINDDNKNLSVFEFKIPSMTQDFVNRVINGRESINGLLHRTPEIKIVMSASLFNTIKDRNDAYNFFKAAVKYYDSQVEKYSMKLISEIMKLNHEMKHLIATTKLSGLVTYPMTLLFAFDNIDMSNKDCFKIDSEDLVKVTKFIKSIYTRYASPEKERKEIINDLRVLIRTLKESLEVDENIKNLSYLPEAVDTLMSGGFDNEMNKAHNRFIYENTDLSWPASSPDPQVKYLSEKFGVKKLKKIPADLVAYIQIETESIRDANDKMMIASYCLSKIEIVEWYIELLEVGSKKYIVPHNKPYLETVRTQLLQCYKEIMAVKITNPNDRPLIDIKYPKGYEG